MDKYAPKSVPVEKNHKITLFIFIYILENHNVSFNPKGCGVGGKSAHWIRIRLVFLQFSSKLLKKILGESCLMSPFAKFFFEKLRMIP